MATARQIAANRRNASLPRGPLTQASAEAIKQNATKHGLCSKHVVLKHEAEADYQDLRASIVTEYQPATAQEHRLADQIAQNYWRLLRARRIETAAFENRLDTLKRHMQVDPKAEIDNDQGLAVCLSTDGRDFDTLRRYETAIERAWYRAIRELRTLQKERRELEAIQPDPPTAKPAAQALAQTASQANAHRPELGFAAFRTTPIVIPATTSYTPPSPLADNEKNDQAAS